MKSIEEIIEKVLFIRKFEEKIIEVYNTDVIKSPVHLSIGQELFSVALASNLTSRDKVVGNYRSHALALAVTNNPQKIADELYAKCTGEYGGRGGSMHLGSSEEGMPWTSAIVASGIPIGVGIAESQKRLNEIDGGNRIVICQFGDGAMEEGVFIESINYASLKRLPILFACEDNGLAIHTNKKARTPDTSYEKRVSQWDVKTRSCSYKKPLDLISTVEKSIEDVRGGKPCFLVAKCYRWIEHVGVGFDWDLGYRDSSELESWKEFDIENNPNIFGVSEQYIIDQSISAKKRVDQIFIQSAEKEDTSVEFLLSNVY